VRALPLLGDGSLALLLAASACDEAAKPPFLPSASPSPAATATPTSVPDTPTPPPESGGLGGFRAFASQVEQAIADGDASFFSDRAKSDLFGLVSVEEYSAMLQAWFASANAGLSDEYGSGAPVLYALAHRLARGDSPETYVAVATGIFIVDTYLCRNARQARCFVFQRLNGQWRLTGEACRPEGFGWLSGDCGDCYDQWERWEGTP
jgi:hypothetical protein